MQVRQVCLLDCLSDIFDILAESKVEHLVSLVKDGILELAEVEISTVHVINHTTTGAHKDVDTTSQLIRLVFDVGSSVDGEYVVLTIVELQGLEFFGNLEGKLSRWGQNHSLRLASTEKSFASKADDHWETKAKGLSGASKVSYNQVFFIRNSPERPILDGE